MALPPSLLIRKNKLHNDAAFIMLVKIEFPGSTIYLANNSDNVVWNGYTWNRTYFTIEPIELNAHGEIPIFNAQIQNIDRTLIPYLDESSGAQGTSVTIYVVDTINLNATPYLSIKMYVVGCIETVDVITFKLGRRNPMIQIFPYYRFMKKYCRFKVFKGPLCSYYGEATECDRTYKRCEELLNQTHFGGFPGIGQGGIYV